MKRFIALFLILITAVTSFACSRNADIILTTAPTVFTTIPTKGSTSKISATSEKTSASDTAPTNPSQSVYILNTNSKKIHFSSCYMADRTSEANKQEYSGDIDTLLSQGYEKCKICFK